MQESKEMFERKLMEFFERHDASKVFLAPKIAEKFSGYQDKVFEYLTSLYAEREGQNKVSEKTLLSLIPEADEGAEPV